MSTFDDFINMSNREMTETMVGLFEGQKAVMTMLIAFAEDGLATGKADTDEWITEFEELSQMAATASLDELSEKIGVALDIVTKEAN